MKDLTADKLAIREMVENWVMWRDTGDWDRFATVWHLDGSRSRDGHMVPGTRAEIHRSEPQTL